MSMTLNEFLRDAFIIFMLVTWFWLMITVISDLFRHDDISGFKKVLWIIFFGVAPYIGVFAYLIFHGHGMGARNIERANKARDELRQVVGYSAADELTKLEALKKAGTISDSEYKTLRARAIAG